MVLRWGSAVLEHPAADILQAFRDQQSGVTTWILVLAVSAALLAPRRILLGRPAGGTLGHWIAGLCVAAAAVQPAWIRILGRLAAVLIATGVLVPLGVGPVSLTSFVGCVAWCLWLIVMAVVLRRPVRNGPAAAIRDVTDPATGHRG